MTDSTDAPVSSTLGAGAAPNSTSDLFGPVIGEKYRVEHVLGRGGMGVVLAARHEILGEPVAIKFLASASAKDAKAAERFVREAKAALKIKGEHVVRILDVGTHQGKPYLVMERLEGTDLGSLLASEGPLPVADAVRYVLQACEALAEAHSQGIVHRDLKPSNLFLTQRPDGSPLVKVLDFGIAKASTEADGTGSNPSLTDTHAVFGSPSYMSPEQIRSAKHVDPRADVWAMGVVLFELLAGRLPFTGESTGAVLASVVADAPPSLRSLRADVPEGLGRAVAQCLEKDITKRMASVADLADAIAMYAPQGTTSSERIRRLSGRPPPVMAPPSAVVVTGSPTTTGNDPTVAVSTQPPAPSATGKRVAWVALIAAILSAGAFVMRRPAPPPPAAARTPSAPTESAPSLTTAEVPTPPSAIAAKTDAPAKPEPPASAKTEPAPPIATRTTGEVGAHTRTRKSATGSVTTPTPSAMVAVAPPDTAQVVAAPTVPPTPAPPTSAPPATPPKPNVWEEMDVDKRPNKK